jgi:hypothetical protein
MSEEENKDIEEDEDMENNYDYEDIESRNNEEDIENDNNEEDEEEPQQQTLIDGIFEQILLNYINETTDTNPRNTYYYGRTSNYNNDGFLQYSTSIYSSVILNDDSEFENMFGEDDEEYNDDEYLNNSFFNRIVNRLIDPIESVLNRSLEEQPSLEKNKEEIEVESVKYETIVEKKEKKCCICLADFLNDEDVSLIKCEHLFHSSCIKEWSTYNITCPVCRKNLKD